MRLGEVRSVHRLLSRMSENYPYPCLMSIGEKGAGFLPELQNIRCQNCIEWFVGMPRCSESVVDTINTWFYIVKIYKPVKASRYYRYCLFTDAWEDFRLLRSCKRISWYLAGFTMTNQSAINDRIGSDVCISFKSSSIW